jgi:hypothetical protein
LKYKKQRRLSCIFLEEERDKEKKKKGSLAINTIPSPTSSVLRGREHGCVSNNTMKA